MRNETVRKLQREDPLQLLDAARIAQTAPGDSVKTRVPEPLPRILSSVGHRESWRRDPVALKDSPTRRLDRVTPLLGRHLSVAGQGAGANAPKPKRHLRDAIPRAQTPPHAYA